MIIDKTRYRQIFRACKVIDQVPAETSESLAKLILKFKIHEKNGQEKDVDGSIREGVMLWFGCENDCNHYQVYWRHDSKLDGIYAGAQKKVNPGKINNLLDGCAGQGYLPLDPMKSAWRVRSPIDIFDGMHHNLAIHFHDQWYISVFLDGYFVLDVQDKQRLFLSRDFGVRSDNMSWQYELLADMV